MIDNQERVDRVAVGEMRGTGPGTANDRPMRVRPAYDGPQKRIFSNSISSAGNASRHCSMYQLSYINNPLHVSGRGGEDTRVAFLSAMKSCLGSKFESSRIAMKPAAFCAKMIKDHGLGS